ncbi:MAG: phytanoyl-CoA dioxygenase [Alphaproteobacteria bacterium]|nr:phytanoyl-CoA dioxygenase [Alphaproteobacteria bacterium]
MPKLLSPDQVAKYERDGYVSPIRAFSADVAAELRAKLEAVEAAEGGPLSGPLRFKPHLLYRFLDEIVYDSTILDAVEDILGPNILCWSSGFFTKEAHDAGFVSWHQDSTYWGLSAPRVTSAWIALTPSTRANGCMRVLPGTHIGDQVSHTDTNAPNNMLSRGQVIDAQIDEGAAVDIELQPGEMSLHHVRLVHGSEPNATNDRRVGFSIRYIPPDVHQTNTMRDSAGLVRGVDRFGHFEHEPKPAADRHPDALAWHARATEIHS